MPTTAKFDEYYEFWRKHTSQESPHEHSDQR